MAYTLNTSNGAVLVTLADGTVNTTACSLTLIGRNVSTYGERQNENIIKLLENFSNSTAPSGNLLSGQLWYNSANSQIQLRTANTWQGLATYNKSSSQPSLDVQSGDMWYNTTTGQISVKSGSSFRLVGPVATTSQGQTQLVAETFVDTGSASHTVLSFYIDSDGDGTGDRVAVISNDSQYNTTAYPGFSTVKPGINLNTTLTNGVFSGTATDADKLDGINSSLFMRTDADNTITANITSSANITANKITGNLTGNGAAITYVTGANVSGAVPSATISATANALTTSRTITLGGNVSGSASFNGSSDITITASLDSERVKVSGDTLTGQLNASRGFTAGSASQANLIYATTTKVGILNNNPQTALDVTGAVRSAVQVNASTSGSITIDGTYNNHQINMTGPVTISFSNFSQTGQIIRLVLVGTENAVSWSSDVYWPNNATVNLNNGNKGIAVVTLMRAATITGAGRPDANFIVATYVSY
jgi:predicted aconitase with swiveling domain